MFNMILFYVRVKTGLFVKASNDVHISSDYVDPFYASIRSKKTSKQRKTLFIEYKVLMA